jgi:phage-related protein
VAYSKFRETKDKEIDYEEKFEKIEKGLLIASPGTVKSKSSLNLEGNPGRELTIERSEGSIRTYRFYFVGDYFYQLSVDIKRPAERDERTARFLNSFKLAARKN